MYLNREEDNSKGSVSLSVFLVSLAVTVCAVWLVALCGVCGWCQRKLGKRNKPGVETADTPDSARGRGEKKAIKGNKPANSPKGQPPDADGHSSVTDLANSLTGD
uniref:Synaptotagmin VIIa n=3 Tax=Percomorphaceae TaxID=1489872 RepID=A0A3P8PP67_ASTCA